MHLFAVAPRQSRAKPFIEAFDRTLSLAQEHGFEGILIFDGEDAPFSPWVLAQRVLAQSALLPLIAAGPAYVSAEVAARNVADLHRLYERPLAINLVAGTTANTGTHSDRYGALRRFSLEFRARLREHDERHSGRAVERASVQMWFVAGHSQEALSLAEQLAATNLRMLPNTLTNDLVPGCGLNFGIVTRPTTTGAWAAARSLYPHRTGAARVVQALAGRTDSTWKAELLSDDTAARGYWRGPAQSTLADSPMYVGSYCELRNLFAACREAAISTFLVDLPPSSLEYEHFMCALAADRHLSRSGSAKWTIDLARRGEARPRN